MCIPRLTLIRLRIGIAGGVIAAILLALCIFCCLRRKHKNKSQEQPVVKQQQPKPAKQPKQPRKPLLGFLGRGKDKKASSAESAFLEVPHDSESSTGGSFTEDAALNPGKSTLTSEYLDDTSDAWFLEANMLTSQTR